MIAVNVLKIVGLMIIVCVALLLLYVLLAPRESTRTMVGVLRHAPGPHVGGRLCAGLKATQP